MNNEHTAEEVFNLLKKPDFSTLVQSLPSLSSFQRADGHRALIEYLNQNQWTWVEFVAAQPDNITKLFLDMLRITSGMKRSDSAGVKYEAYLDENAQL